MLDRLEEDLQVIGGGEQRVAPSARPNQPQVLVDDRVTERDLPALVLHHTGHPTVQTTASDGWKAVWWITGISTVMIHPMDLID